MSFNFDQEQPETFEFTMGGHKYKFKYPTLDEIREIVSLQDAEAMDARIKVYISTEDAEAPDIEVVLGKLKGKSLKAWRKMINEEVLAL
jgi:hypothetical protein